MSKYWSVKAFAPSDASTTGSMIGTVALGCIVAPFFVGMFADRFFAGQRVLGVLNILGAALLLVMSQTAVDADGQKQPFLFWWLMFALGETGTAIRPGYSWPEAIGGIVAEAIYLPLAAFLTGRLVADRLE